MRVGILGGGQLGVMLAEAVLGYGAEVSLYDPDANAPARRYSGFRSAGWDDTDALQDFFDACDVVTYEFENVSTQGLKKLVGLEKLNPSISVLEICQNRQTEKEFLKQNGFPIVDFGIAHAINEVVESIVTLKPPVIVKSAAGGYDGHHQYRVLVESDVDRMLGLIETANLANVRWVIERALDLEAELSCIVARSPDQTRVFPAFENIHREGILDATLLPARIAETVQHSASEIAVAIAEALNVHGLLTVEFFVDRQTKKLYVNELAPRPHNSGHITRKACTMSQFDALARILLGIPMPPIEMASQKAYCMGNLLGDVWTTSQGKCELQIDALGQHPEIVELILYGKAHPRPRRKMGHFTLRSDSPSNALAIAQAFRNNLRQKST